MPAEPLVEMAALAGLDYLVIDCEHGPDDLVALQHHLVGAQAYGIDVLVRVGEDEPGLVLRSLDLGASGVVVPRVEDVEDARRAVAHAHYPPLGERGFATYGRAGRYGTVEAAEHLRRAAESTLVVVMIETAEGCDNARGILSVDGVDAVLVGPADLAVSLGLPEAGAVDRAVAAVHAEAGRAGRTVLSIVGDTAGAERARSTGATVLYNLTAVLRKTLEEAAAVGSSNPGGVQDTGGRAPDRTL
ncbi:HpcH/HpaI aldolase family protein [Streptomyces sp. NPDC002454]|uniref:HpcH/HpaI aldolase family protein n=1 Tax=Streptomyces sp. NPDC002490 TaxID=3154416 RepID=UPI0033244CA5